MSRGRGDGRGRGRGRGGGGAPPRGGGRAGGGGQHNWGEGRVLGEPLFEGAAQNGAGFRGRGRGRGGAATRGHALRASKQNAVGFDYGTPSPSGSGQQTPVKGAQNVGIDDDDEDDIILDTHRSYRHVIKPHLEEEGRPQRHSATTHENGMPMMLPPSVSNLHARTPNNHFALERAQRAMQGQVAGLIPTGPKSAHVHRMYGTLDQVHNHQRSRQPQPRPSFPLPVSTKTNEKSQKSKADRPLENSTGDPCIAGIPRSTPRRDAVDKSRFLRGGASSGLSIPVQFMKATGEWKDGAWIRASDGKETVTAELLNEAQEQQTGQPSDPFDRMAGAGLGYHGKHGDKEKARDSSVGEDVGMEAPDPIEALLRAFPGSEEMQVDDEFGSGVDSFGFNSSAFHPTPEPASRPSDVQAQDSEEAFFIDRKGDTRVEDDEDDDDEEILIAQTTPAPGKSQMVESDSEEERQLDEIIRRGAAARGDLPAEVEVEVESKESFFVDLTGEEGRKEVGKVVSYNNVQMAPLGQQLSREEIVHATESDGDDHIPSSDRTALKKAKRKQKKGARARRAARVAREGDSDLDWGSNGPPVKFRQKADQDSFEHDSGIERLSLDAAAALRDGEEEDTMLALALANSVEEQYQPNITNKRSQKEAILADYMQNAMGIDDTAEHGDVEDMVTEKRGDKDVNERSDMDALLAFMNGMDGQRQGRAMTMEDIAIEHQMQEEDEWMTESEGSDDATNAAIQKEELKLEPDSQGQASESDSDGSSEEGVEGRHEKRQESWSDSEDSADSDSDSDDDDEEAFDRQFSWADADEDFIARLDKFAHANDAVLKGRDRKARSKLFKMIESGNFGDFDEEDIAMDGDDPVFGPGAREPVRGGKNVKKPFKAGDLWAEELQAQWEKDRSTKAANKRKRAAERALAAESPFHATQIKKGTKKMAKKAARAERRAARRSDGRVGQRSGMDVDEDDEDDEAMVDGPLARHATNLTELDNQIQLFLRDTGKTTLSLAPMDKRARAQVHLLANCYNLVSKSKGNGNKRFPTLIKNQRSGLNVNVRKINSILRGASGSFGSGGFRGDNSKFKDRTSGSAAAHIPKNQEGAAVGFGAERIGVDNVGHRLLSMMGWSEGSGVGLTQGAADPIGATIKVTKGGLGF